MSRTSSTRGWWPGCLSGQEAPLFLCNAPIWHLSRIAWLPAVLQLTPRWLSTWTARPWDMPRESPFSRASPRTIWHSVCLCCRRSPNHQFLSCPAPPSHLSGSSLQPPADTLWPSSLAPCWLPSWCRPRGSPQLWERGQTCSDQEPTPT